jgi:hypothetical protein
MNPLSSHRPTHVHQENETEILSSAYFGAFQRIARELYFLWLGRLKSRDKAYQACNLVNLLIGSKQKLRKLHSVCSVSEYKLTTRHFTG